MARRLFAELQLKGIDSGWIRLHDDALARVGEWSEHFSDMDGFLSGERPQVWRWDLEDPDFRMKSWPSRGMGEGYGANVRTLARRCNLVPVLFTKNEQDRAQRSFAPRQPRACPERGRRDGCPTFSKRWASLNHSQAASSPAGIMTSRSNLNRKSSQMKARTYKPAAIK